MTKLDWLETITTAVRRGVFQGMDDFNRREASQLATVVPADYGERERELARCRADVNDQARQLVDAGVTVKELNQRIADGLKHAEQREVTIRALEARVRELEQHPATVRRGRRGKR